MQLLAISGSLRAASSNTRIVEALARLAPADTEVIVYRGLGNLPHFNPDLEAAPPEAVMDLRRQIGAADGLIICSPEYAHGVAGVMKNGLDWLVPSVEFPQIPIALINTSPGAHHALDHIRETLTVMSGRLIEGACVTASMSGRTLGPDQIAGDRELAPVLRRALLALVTAIRDAGPRPIWP